MERVTFLLEDTGQRIGCLLNPDSVVVRRRAGIRERRAVAGQLTGAGLADDPLLFTGGGRTELELDLLFDTALGDSDGTTAETQDVQDLTRPLWELAENFTGADGFGQLRTVRLVWGKSWNVPGVVSAIAERFERFDQSGVPQRSWMRMRLVRVGASAATTPTIAQAPTAFATASVGEVDEDQVIIHEVVGGADVLNDTAVAVPGERLDDIAARYYGEPSLWRVIAAYNGVADPTRIPPPRTLRIPPLSSLRNL
jgi:nucleoid-associated protein YgaU